MSSENRILVNGIDVSDLLEWKYLPDHKIGEPATCWLGLAKEANKLCSVDLRGRITVDVVIDGQIRRLFSGVITEAEDGQKDYMLKCMDPQRIMEEKRTGGAFGQGLWEEEIFFLLAWSAMPESVHLDAIQVRPTLRPARSLADLKDLLFGAREYVYIAPIPSCKITESDIQFAGVRVFKAEKAVSEDSEYITKAVTSMKLDEKSMQYWHNSTTRAEIRIEAKGFHDAFDKGRAKFARLLDYLSFASNFSTPCFTLRGEHHYHHYRRDTILTNIAETAWAYVRDTYRTDRYWLRWFSPHRYDDSIGITNNDPILSLHTFLQHLIAMDDASLSDNERSLLSSVHAMRQARQSENPTDALGHFWRATEFLLTNYNVTPLFSKQDRADLISAAKTVVLQKYVNEHGGEQARRLQRLDSYLNRINDVPIRTKWSLFCINHGIEFSKEEEDLLWNLKTRRNDLQHGRETIATWKEINAILGMLEKVIVAALNDLASSAPGSQ